ncbi:cytochrome c [Achromobacter seleniivolatilans]|uniref:Cytochrome c n=1 Tax=Achromobacter seleniivolatilans TaxID=3047478 RepID=A0ABY9M1L7_9BURK|nr:cytochrome c [Achromobacter sp. R39]WMD20889.1 cytochrome c [Achromobacter sp. R39]
MMRIRHYIARAACPLVVALVGLSTSFVVQAQSIAATAPSDEQMLIVKGRYLATAGDCVACHTARPDQPFAGGVPLSSPMGTIYSTNITPSKTAGIGNYSLEDFSRALREGVAPGGRHLYPAMPYTAYAGINDEDVKALYAYFMHGIAPIDVKARATELPFPFNVRLSMVGWNLLFLDTLAPAPPNQSPQWLRGRYLTETLAHCSTCHTPRNALMAEDKNRNFAGASLGAWYAPNITSDPISGIGGWSIEELFAYLKTGHAQGKAQAAGPMLEAVDHSFSKLTDSDLQAIAAYVKTVPAQQNPGTTRPAYGWGKAQDLTAAIINEPWPEDRNLLSGAQLYNGYCASCHQANGAGSNGLPSLAGNTALGQPNADNAVMAILEGVHHSADSTVVDSMPAFGHELNDGQVATLVNFLQQNYGRPDVGMTPERVATLRAGGAPSPLVKLAPALVVGTFVIFLLLLLLVFRWRRRKRRLARR